MNENLNVEVHQTEPSRKKSALKWDSKECRVINYVPSKGILGFDFNGVGCQITVEKNLNIGSTIQMKYQGKIGKNIKFKL